MSNLSKVTIKREENQRKTSFSLFSCVVSGAQYYSLSSLLTPLIPELRSPIPADAPTRSLSRSLSSFLSPLTFQKTITHYTNVLFIEDCDSVKHAEHCTFNSR